MALKKVFGQDSLNSKAYGNEIVDPYKFLSVIDCFSDKETLKVSLISGIDSKLNYYRLRYDTLKSRILRNEHFGCSSSNKSSFKVIFTYFLAF